MEAAPEVVKDPFRPVMGTGVPFNYIVSLSINDLRAKSTGKTLLLSFLALQHSVLFKQSACCVQLVFFS